MNNLIVSSGDTALAVPGHVPIAGLDNLSADDFSLPTLKLVQAQSTVEGADEHLGQWYRADTGEFIEAPMLIILGIAKSRVMFKKPFDGEKEPLCRSDNANFPRPEYVNKIIGEVQIPDNCNHDCPFARWGSNGERPACDLVDNWAALTDSGDPVILRFSGSAAKVSTQLKNLARAATIKKRVLYVQLGSRQEKGRIGKYFVPVVTIPQDQPPAELVEIAAQFAGINLAERAATESETPDDDGRSTSPRPSEMMEYTGTREDEIPF